MQSKINQCAVCSSRKNLRANFCLSGKLYFLCAPHDELSKLLFSTIDRVVRRTYERSMS